MKRSILNECLRRAYEKHNPSHPSWNFKSVHYSFVVQKNKVLEMGVNRPHKTVNYYGYPEHAFTHSEVDAWTKARGLLAKDQAWEIINIRIYKEVPYKIGDAAPCPCCMAFLINNNCKNIYFSASNSGFAKMIAG